MIKAKTQHIFELTALGEITVVRSLYFINVIDWASFYLAEVNKVDAVEVEVIGMLKGKLI